MTKITNQTLKTTYLLISRVPVSKINIQNLNNIFEEIEPFILSYEEQAWELEGEKEVLKKKLRLKELLEEDFKLELKKLDKKLIKLQNKTCEVEIDWNDLNKIIQVTIEALDEESYNEAVKWRINTKALAELEKAFN